MKAKAWWRRGVVVCVLIGAVSCRGGGENQPTGAEAASDGGAETWLVARMAVRAAYLAVATGWGVAKNLPRLMRGRESHVGEYGPAFNGERRKLGIPGIPADWVLTEDGGQCFTYGKPSAEGGLRAEITVCCNRKTGAISSEEHRYYSGRTHSVEGEGGDWPECVLFRYTYGKPENPWWFHYDHDANCGECREKGRDLGPDGFDALLEEWGFERVFAPEGAEEGGGMAAARPNGDGEGAGRGEWSNFWGEECGMRVEWNGMDGGKDLFEERGVKCHC